MVEGDGFEPSKLTRQIYSLLPLATREPPQRDIFILNKSFPNDLAKFGANNSKLRFSVKHFYVFFDLNADFFVIKG